MHSNKKYLFFLACLFAPLFFSCNQNNNHRVTIERFDFDIQEYPDLDSIGKYKFQVKYSPVVELYINAVDTTSNSTDDKLKRFANSKSITYFSEDVKKAFLSVDSLEAVFGIMKKSFQENFNLDFPSVFSAVIPYNQSVILNDSILIIGLNHYLGKDYPPYEYFPEYQRKAKCKDKIPYDVAEAILKTHYPYHPENNTLLEKMLYEGAIAYAISIIVPQYSDDRYLSIEPEKMAWCVEKEREIWNQLLLDDILFTTSAKTQNELLSPAPFSAPISQQVPGQIGRWIGKHIIAKFLKNENLSVCQLLNDDIYKYSQDILINSKYNGAS